MRVRLYISSLVLIAGTLTAALLIQGGRPDAIKKGNTLLFWRPC